MRAKRPQSTSVTQMTEYVLPQHTNALGSVFGGQIMAWIDLCAAISAQRFSGHMAVTAFVDDLKFEQPVRVGEVVRLEACVTATFRTSMELEVIVEGEDAMTGRRWPCVTARLTFVAIDVERRPTPIAALLLDTPEVKASQAAGEARRASRLRIAPSTEGGASKAPVVSPSAGGSERHDIPTMAPGKHRR
jgi:acyl-CoA hydrolase